MSPSSKVVVITGVSRGLGRAMTAEFIRRGHRVVGCGRRVVEITQMRDQYGALHCFSLVDVSSDEQVQSWAREVLRRFGPPDILVNNAAVINNTAPLWEVSAAEFGKVIDVNIKGVANVLRHFLPEMVKRRTGVVVNFSSGWGRSTERGEAPYCATKWAIEGLTQALAQELPEGMAAIPLNPGIINTEMLRTCFGDAAAGYPSPEEWAEGAVPFLLKLRAEHSGKPMTVV